MADGSEVDVADRARLELFVSAGDAEVAVLTIANGPLNLFDEVLFAALAARLRDLTNRPPRALIVRAEGRVFSAGVDVRMFEGLGPAAATSVWRSIFAEICHPLEMLPCPVVFATQGLTLTAAFEVALACDIILATPDATFGLVEQVVGLTPSMGGPQRLAERAGSGRARELVMTGDIYDAATMHAWGVVNAVHADVDTAARELAVRLAEGPTLAHAATKHVIGTWRSGGVQAADVTTPFTSAALFATADLQNAVRSFLDVGPGRARFVGN